MKKKFLSVAVILTLASSMMFTSCIGSFALFNKLKDWNNQIGGKFVNEIVFFAFWVLPVYEIAVAADVLVLNTIEFWSGENPASASTKIVDGKDARYLVKSDKDGYEITNLTTQEVVKFNFDAADNSWSIEANGKEQKFMTFVDDNHVKMITPDGYETIELSQAGVLAYQEIATRGAFAMN